MRTIKPVAASQPTLDPPSHRWGVVLAGGDGVRLRSLTRFVSGDERPKQFCPLFGGGISLVGRTRQRISRLISAARTLFPVTRSHEKFYADELNDARTHLIVQPANRGTAPPIAFSLLSIADIDPNAVVAILPSDHYYSDDARFTATLEQAFELSEKDPDTLTLVAASPTHPETEFGWIETAAISDRHHADLFRVHTFHEKPSHEVARFLFQNDSLWNTFVMVGHVCAFLSLVRAASPGLLNAIRMAPLWAGCEAHLSDSLYRTLEPVDFSRDILSTNPADLLALRLRDVEWSDLGDPGRALAALAREQSQPDWVRSWRPSTALQTTFAATA